MDIELARTFLEVVRVGSFIAAAESLHVTQTTVTARIKNLESQLECRLFVRNRAGASLTDDGRHFMNHAQQIVQTWSAAKRDLPLHKDSGHLLIIGSELSLWNPLLLDWVNGLHVEYTGGTTRIEVAEHDTLVRRVEHGLLDIAVVHQASYWPGLVVRELLEEKLIRVVHPSRPQPYIYVDWGPSFQEQHDTALPDHAAATLRFDLGPLALHHLLEQGGSGYFRTRVVERYLKSGELLQDNDAPEFPYPIYYVHRRDNRNTRLKLAVRVLKAISHQPQNWSQPIR